MTDKRVLSAIRNLSGRKPVFALSEIVSSLDTPCDPEALYREIAGDLKGLGLTAVRKGSDYEVSRISPADAYTLDSDESASMDRFFGQREIPAGLQTAIEQYIARKVGKDWTDPVILERLRHAIIAQKDDYWKPQHKRSLRYTKAYSVLGYLAYHLPVYFMQTEYLLSRLARQGRLKKKMIILDVGTGPGVVPLAIADFYSRLTAARADVYSLERSEENIEAFLALRESCVPRGGNVSLKPPVRADLLSDDAKGLPAKVDLLVFSNVLNELPDASMDLQAGIVARMAERLAPDGSVLIIEPADEENATRMRSLTVALREKGLHVADPCAFIWGVPCSAPRCWSFMTGTPIKPTRLMETLSRCEESFRFINTDIKYSFAVLERNIRENDGFRLEQNAKFLRFSRLQQHTEKRINAAGLKMSGELGNARTHVFKICDGTAKTPVYAVLPSYHRTPGNESLVTAPYGSLLEMSGVLVRYNRAHDAYNLLVNRNSRVVCHEPGLRDGPSRAGFDRYRDPGINLAD